MSFSGVVILGSPESTAEVETALRAALAAISQGGRRGAGVHPSVPCTPENFLSVYGAVQRRDDVDVVVDLTEWTEDAPNLSLAETAVAETLCNKSVIASSPLFVARSIRELHHSALRHGQYFLYEAASGLHLPILTVLRDMMPGDPIHSIFCRPANLMNAILDARSEPTERPRFLERGPVGPPLLSQSQALKTSSYRLAILSSVAFGRRVIPEEISKVGIDQILPLDFDYVQHRLGRRITFLEILEWGRLAPKARIGPCLIDQRHLLASVVSYATVAVGSHLRGSTLFAGRGPTSPTSLILRDLTLVATDGANLSGLDIVDASPETAEDVRSDYYLRFIVRDRPGLVGVIGQALGASGLNVDQILQLEHKTEEIQAIKEEMAGEIAETWSAKLRETPEHEILPFVITVKQAGEAPLAEAMRKLNDAPFILFPILCLRNETPP